MSRLPLSSCLTLSPVLLQLSNRLFEELAMDVYDEVDRRENDAGERGVRAAAPRGRGRGWGGRGGGAAGGAAAEPCALPPIWTRPPGPQAPPSSFLRPGRFAQREGPPLGARAGVLPEVGAGIPQGWGLSLRWCPCSGGWQGGGNAISVAGRVPADISNHLPTSWGVLNWCLKG